MLLPSFGKRISPFGTLLSSFPANMGSTIPLKEMGNAILIINDHMELLIFHITEKIERAIQLFSPLYNHSVFKSLKRSFSLYLGSRFWEFLEKFCRSFFIFKACSGDSTRPCSFSSSEKSLFRGASSIFSPGTSMSDSNVVTTSDF